MRGGRISVAIEPGPASKYFSQREIWVDYGDLDLHEVPVSTALLPALGTILPVAVAAGVGIRAPEIDAAFATQAPPIAAQLQGMYPHLSQSPLEVQGQIIHRDKTSGANLPPGPFGTLGHRPEATGSGRQRVAMR